MSEPDPIEQLREYLGTFVQLRQPPFDLPRISEHYSCIEEFVLRHGEVWTPQELPRRFAPRQPKACFFNAATIVRQARRSGRRPLRYVEGFATTAGLGLAVHHAWAVDEEGLVIDPTWTTAGPGIAYLGIVFDLDQLPRGAGSSVLDNWHDGWPLLQEPFAVE